MQILPYLSFCAELYPFPMELLYTPDESAIMIGLTYVLEHNIS